MMPETACCMITGASGFVGRALVPRLAADGFEISSWPRGDPGFDLATCRDNAALPSWTRLLEGTGVVVHLAGIAHRLDGETRADTYKLINTDATLLLARAAIAAGVRRFVFLSTAKVFGEGGDTPYSPDSVAHPQDAYAQSKWEAEQGLLALAKHSPLEVVIIRPPLVYGSGARANFAQLLHLARSPLPLPTAGISNRRSMIGIDNLVEFIAHCIHCPAAANGTWLCADKQPYSLSEIISTARQVYKRPSRQFAVPPALLKAAIKTLLGAPAVTRLLGNFELDTGFTERALEWSPPFDMATILRRGVLPQ